MSQVPTEVMDKIVDAVSSEGYMITVSYYEPGKKKLQHFHKTNDFNIWDVEKSLIHCKEKINEKFKEEEM